MLRPDDYRKLVMGEFENTPESLMAQYVERAKRSAPGGTGYFERLDAYISRDGGIHRALVDLAAYHFPRASIITSGGFGMEHSRWSRANRAGVLPLVLPGGLRHKPRPEYNMAFRDWGYRMAGVRSWVFLDDSLYAGRTMDWVRDLVLMTGGAFEGAVVAYDGSHQKRRNVHSLYRYFDHHPLPE